MTTRAEYRVSKQGLMACPGCQCHIKVQITVAATTCPFCGYQMENDVALPTTASRARMKRRSRAWLTAAMLGTSVVLAAAPVGCNMYGGPPESYFQGELNTDQPSNSLIFDITQQGKLLQKTFILYNNGKSELSISSIRLTNDPKNVFQLLSPPATPMTLAPGKNNGIPIEVQFRVGVADNSSARLEIRSNDATNANEDGLFFVELKHNVQEADPRWKCGGQLEFGAVEKGEAVTRECVLENRGNGPLVIEKIAYNKDKGGDSIDFSIIGPTTPMTLAAGDNLPIQIQYRPDDDKPPEDSGAFILSVQNRAALTLNVQGSAKNRAVDIIGLYPPCTTNDECTTIDPRLSCQTEDISQQRLCIADNPEQPFLKLPVSTPGATTQRDFVLRNLSSQPITIKSFAWTKNNDTPFALKFLVPLPVTLQPNKRLQATVLYERAGTAPLKRTVEIRFADLPTQHVVVEYSP